MDKRIKDLVPGDDMWTTHEGWTKVWVNRDGLISTDEKSYEYSGIEYDSGDKFPSAFVCNPFNTNENPKEANVDAFIEEINDRLGDVLEIVKSESTNNCLCFELILKDNDYVMRDQVVVTMSGEFKALVKEVSSNYFIDLPSFNNLGRVFWFI